MKLRDLINEVTNGELDNYTLDTYSSPALDYELVIYDIDLSKDLNIDPHLAVDKDGFCSICLEFLSNQEIEVKSNVIC